MHTMEEVLGKELTDVLHHASHELAQELASDGPPDPLKNPEQKIAMLEAQANAALESLSSTLAEGGRVLMASLKQLSHTRSEINYEKITEELRRMGETINKGTLEALAQEDMKGDSAGPQAVFKLPKETLLALFDAAAAILNEKRFHDAMNAFMLLCSIQPDDYDHWMGYGHAAYHNKEYDSAISAYYMAATLRAEDPWPLVWAANACEAKGEIDAVIDLLTHAKEFSKAHPEREMRALAHEIQERLAALSLKK